MSAWSSLRRYRPSLIRQFCVLSAPPPLPPKLPPSSPPLLRLKNAGGTTSTPFLRWVSGIITASTVALAFYSYPSSSPNFSSLSFADSSVQPAVAAITSVSVSGDHVTAGDDHFQQQGRQRFLFGGIPVIPFLPSCSFLFLGSWVNIIYIPLQNHIGGKSFSIMRNE